MSTLVVFAGTSDGHIQSGNTTTYSLARSGGGPLLSADAASTSFVSGQESFSSKFYCYEVFLDFDTSPLGASATVSAAVLSLWGIAAQVSETSAFTHNARLSDWGATLTSADFIPGASLSALTLLAHLAQTSVSQGAYNAFVDDAFPANVNKTGNTRLLVSSTRHEAGTAPATPAKTEYENWRSADQAGTTNDPKLTVTYTVPGPTDHFGVSGMFGV